MNLLKVGFVYMMNEKTTFKFKSKSCSEMIETHPYEPFVDKDTRIIIIGTTPPMRFTQKLPLNEDDVNFYYGSRDNYFWTLIGDLFEVNFLNQNSLEAVQQRKVFLIQNKIGLVDIVNEFSRSNNDASDNNLHVTKFQDIYSILKNNPQIQKVYFTGYSGPNSAESLTSRHLGERKVFNTILSHNKPKHKIFKIENRPIHSYSLYSPSPAARKKYADILVNYQVLKNDN